MLASVENSVLIEVVLNCVVLREGIDTKVAKSRFGDVLASCSRIYEDQDGSIALNIDIVQGFLQKIA